MFNKVVPVANSDKNREFEADDGISGGELAELVKLGTAVNITIWDKAEVLNPNIISFSTDIAKAWESSVRLSFASWNTDSSNLTWLLTKILLDGR